MIDNFRGKYYFLSNFYKSNIKVNNGKIFPSSEHLFQALKTKNKDEQEKIRLCKTPGEAKKLGYKVQLVDNWEDVKIAVMEKILFIKFTRNDTLKELLLATEERELIEGNTWHDNFWGNCTCPKCKNIEGKNNLGKLLMKLRTQIKEHEENYENSNF